MPSVFVVNIGLPLQSCFMSFRFEIEATDGKARAGRFFTPHGVVETPVFMPVGTLGSVKGVPQDTLEELGVQILLNNTYHLYLRPGVEMVRSLGGVQRFMAWDKPILTDSGGFQVFSLSELAQSDRRWRGVSLAPRWLVAHVHAGEFDCGADRAGRGHHHGVR